MTDVARVLAGEQRMLIDGELQHTASGAKFDVIHPASEQVAGQATDGTVDDMARDVSAFLAWTAEPKMEERKSLGFMVLIYLAVLAGLLYFVKKKIWADQH